MCRQRRRAVQNQTSWISPQGPADETETAHAWPKQPMGYTHAKPRMMVANAHSLKKENSRYDKIGHCNSRTMILLTSQKLRSMPGASYASFPHAQQTSNEMPGNIFRGSLNVSSIQHGGYDSTAHLGEYMAADLCHIFRMDIRACAFIYMYECVHVV